MQENENEDENLLEGCENEEVEVFEPFMVEDKDEGEMKACSLCSLQKNGNMICGIFKAYDNFRKSRGYPPIEDTFSCSDFKESE